HSSSLMTRHWLLHLGPLTNGTFEVRLSRQMICSFDLAKHASKRDVGERKSNDRSSFTLSKSGKQNPHVFEDKNAGLQTAPRVALHARSRMVEPDGIEPTTSSLQS